MTMDFSSMDREETMAHKLLESVFETVSNGLQILEAVRDNKQRIIDFRFMFVNSNAYLNNKRSLFGGQPGIQDNALFQQLKKVIESGDPLDEMFRYVIDGADKWLHIRAQKFGDGLVISRSDLTGSKHAEASLMLLNRSLSSKNQELLALGSELKTFNTIAANDYNETLKNLYTCLEFIVSNDARNLSDAGKANLRRAQAAIQKMKLLTEDIIAYSNIHTEEQLSRIDLNEVLVNVANTMTEKIRENQVTIVYSNLPNINGYPLLVTILFNHLIDNAIKFRKDEKHPVITITYHKAEGSDINHPAALKDVRYDVIAVVDNGIGFDAEEHDKIFTMFYRAKTKSKTKGSGIGLAICKKIMDLHKGFITSECNPECTTFLCYFPERQN